MLFTEHFTLNGHNVSKMMLTKYGERKWGGTRITKREHIAQLFSTAPPTSSEVNESQLIQGKLRLKFNPFCPIAMIMRNNDSFISDLSGLSVWGITDTKSLRCSGLALLSLSE